MSDPPIVVLKVGGSLLTLPDLRPRFESLLAQRQEVRPLLVCGGGAAADFVRETQVRHRLSDEAAHWLALKAMTLNEALIAHLIPSAVSVSTADEALVAWAERRLPVVCAEAWLQEQKGTSGCAALPHNWEVTSDSIAAWIALQAQARELVLLKSVDLPAGLSLQDACDRGLVDRHFARLDLRRLRISWINLRADLPVRVTWRERTLPIDA